jgi:hypothetical protein
MNTLFTEIWDALPKSAQEKISDVTGTHIVTPESPDVAALRGAAEEFQYRFYNGEAARRRIHRAEDKTLAEVCRRLAEARLDDADDAERSERAGLEEAAELNGWRGR